MGPLGSIIEANKEAFKTSNADKNTGAIHLAVKVLSFDDYYVYGERIDNKEEIKIGLGKFQKKENAEFDRPSFDKIFNNGKKSVRIGGVLQFENAQMQNDGSYSARWVNVVAKDDTGETRAVNAKTQVYFGTSGDNKYISIRTIFPDRSQKFESMEQVKAVLSRILSYSSDGVVPFFAFKVFDDAGTEPTLIEARAKLVDVDDGGVKRRQVARDPSVSVGEFIQSNFGSILKQCIEADGVSVVGCNGVSMFVGNATRDNFMKKKSSAVTFMKKEFLINKDGDYHFNNMGYKDVIVGVRVDGSMKYVTHFMSLSPYADAEGILNIL